jgi:hypothetical protein
MDIEGGAMIPRRQVLGGGLLGGVLGAMAGAESEAADGVAAAAQRSDEIDMREVVQAINSLKTELHNQSLFTEIAAVRDAQKMFLRANGKLPDFIDVSSDIWFAAYDWHVRWQQPINIGRDPSGRLTLLVLQTMLVMRPEALSNYMSIPYDTR